MYAMLRLEMKPTLISVVIGLGLTGVAVVPTAAQDPVVDPEVQAQIGLFSAWLEGQIEYRGLPGIVVGVVSDQDLM